MAVFIKDPKGWNQLTRDPDGIIGRDMARRGRYVERNAKRQVGKKTFKLVKSINSKVTVDFRGLSALIGSSNRIALIHHEGSRAHVIRPRRAKTLRFQQNGRIRYAQRVFHPGTRPNRYLSDQLPGAVR